MEGHSLDDTVRPDLISKRHWETGSQSCPQMSITPKSTTVLPNVRNQSKADTFVGESALQGVEIGQHVDTVNAAVREEVEDNHFSTQILVNRKRLFCVQPF